MSPIHNHFDHSLVSPKKVVFEESGIPNSNLISRRVEIERMLDESDEEDDKVDQAIHIGAMARAMGPI